MSLVSTVRRVASGIAWYVRAVSGEDAYEKYLAHHESGHGALSPHPVLTEREFWRDRTDRQDANPQGRCC